MFLATALAAAAASGRGAIAVVPTAKNLDLLEAALAERLPADSFVRLSSDSTPHTRYHGFVKARLGQVPVVIGSPRCRLRAGGEPGSGGVLG